MVAAAGTPPSLRDWVACLVRPLTDHLADLGNPTWYARFAAQAMTDPAYHGIVVKDALSSPSLVEVVDGINRCLPDLPLAIRYRAQHHGPKPVDAQLRRPRACVRQGATVARTSWQAAGSGLIDAIVGMWLAPVTQERRPS